MVENKIMNLKIHQQIHHHGYNRNLILEKFHQIIFHKKKLFNLKQHNNNNNNKLIQQTSKINIFQILKLEYQQILFFIYNNISRLAFRFIYIIGKGGFGKVWRVEMKSTKKEFALKEMIKAKIISKRSVNSVMNEKFLLEHLRHPFLVNMHFAFQDKENLYLVLDLLRGGDLRFHIGKLKRFTEDQAKFFACCMLQQNY